MKRLLLKLIYIYQITPLHSHSRCKYYPTCSNYSKEAISRYGTFRGIWLTLKRILRCNWFFKGGIDLVPTLNTTCKSKKKVVKFTCKSKERHDY